MNRPELNDDWPSGREARSAGAPSEVQRTSDLGHSRFCCFARPATNGAQNVTGSHSSHSVRCQIHWILQPTDCRRQMIFTNHLA